MGRPEISGVTIRPYFVSLNVTVPITGPTPFMSMELMVARAVAAYAVAAASASTNVEMSTARRIILLFLESPIWLDLSSASFVPLSESYARQFRALVQRIQSLQD